jgi:hypothetical protein
VTRTSYDGYDPRTSRTDPMGNTFLFLGRRFDFDTGAWAPLRTMRAVSSGSHGRLPSALIPGVDHSVVPLRGRLEVNGV